MNNQNDQICRPIRSITWAEREEMVQEYLTGQYNKIEVWKKHGLCGEEHGTLLKWMRKLGYITVTTEDRSRVQLLRNYKPMGKNKPNPPSNRSGEKKEDTAALERKIKELEDRLKLAEVKAEGLELMIDIAEKDFKLPIRKKRDTK